MSQKEIKETVEASSEFANTSGSMITDTRGSVIRGTDLSPEDKAEIDKLFDPDLFEKMTKEQWEWTIGMAQAMTYCKNPKTCNSQWCNVRKKTKTEAEPKDHKYC